MATQSIRRLKERLKRSKKISQTDILIDAILHVYSIFLGIASDHILYLKPPVDDSSHRFDDPNPARRLALALRDLMHAPSAEPEDVFIQGTSNLFFKLC